MLQTEVYKIRSDGARLIRTYSDEGYMIRQIETGILYAEAIDIEGKYTYAETKIPAPVLKPETEDEEIEEAPEET